MTRVSCRRLSLSPQPDNKDYNYSLWGGVVLVVVIIVVLVVVVVVVVVVVFGARQLTVQKP